MRNNESPRPIPIGPSVTARIVDGLDAYIADLGAANDAMAHLPGQLQREVVADVDVVLGNKVGVSYRDGVLIQLAFGLLIGEGFDHTQRAEGARGVAQALGKANAQRHVPKVNDAYENIGKNQPNLARGNVPEFDRLLRWMNTATQGQREALLSYVLARVALTARPVAPMPPLRLVELTFARTTALLDDLFARPSGGAHQQYSVAAFLGALIDQFGFGGVGALSVRTKNINTSDVSAGTAADVQITRGNMIDEVFEVSANDWRQKVEQAVQAARRAGLQRAHILASAADTSDLVSFLEHTTVDVSVTEVRSFVRTICSILRPPAREDALRRLYGYLDTMQPDINLTNGYVALLRDHALAAD